MTAAGVLRGPGDLTATEGTEKPRETALES